VDQVDSQIREWEASADKLETMTSAEARRYVSGKQPMTSRFLQMTVDMQHKIRNEAPSKDAETRLLEAWRRRTVAYQKMMSMLAASAPTTSTPTTTFTAAAAADSGHDKFHVNSRRLVP